MNQKGAIPLLILIVAMGIFVMLGLLSTSPFKSGFLYTFFPKDQSFASTLLPGETGNLSLTPETATFNRGCSYQIDIEYNIGGGQTNGIDAVIFYDQSRITVNSISNGNIFSTYPGVIFANNIINVSGITEAPPAPPVSGSGILATLNIMIPSNASLGSALLNFDFDPNNKQKTTDSNIPAPGGSADLLSSVNNGNYQIGSGTCSGTNPVSSPVSPSSAPAKPGDIDGDNSVDIFDYNQLLTDFGKQQSGLSRDIDKNGKVDIFDYNILLTNFGT